MSDMTELHKALDLASRILDRPNADPDDDLAVLARSLLRTPGGAIEWVKGFTAGQDDLQPRIDRLNRWLDAERERNLALRHENRKRLDCLTAIRSAVEDDRSAKAAMIRAICENGGGTG